MGGGRDWTAGIPACNVAFFSDVKLRRSQVARAFSCFALMQARMPAVQSHPPSPVSRLFQRCGRIELCHFPILTRTISPSGCSSRITSITRGISSALATN